MLSKLWWWLSLTVRVSTIATWIFASRSNFSSCSSFKFIFTFKKGRLYFHPLSSIILVIILEWCKNVWRSLLSIIVRLEKTKQRATSSKWKGIGIETEKVKLKDWWMLKWPLVIENRRELFELVVVRHSEADHNTQYTMN